MQSYVRNVLTLALEGPEKLIFHVACALVGPEGALKQQPFIERMPQWWQIQSDLFMFR